MKLRVDAYSPGIGHTRFDTVVSLTEECGDLADGQRLLATAVCLQQNLPLDDEIDIDDEVLKDLISQMIPVDEHLSAAAALAAARQADVASSHTRCCRDGLKDRGTVWIIGSGEDSTDWDLQQLFDTEEPPATIVITDIPEIMKDWLQSRTIDLGIHLFEMEGEDEIALIEKLSSAFSNGIDDVIVLGNTRKRNMSLFLQHLAPEAVLCLVGRKTSFGTHETPLSEITTHGKRLIGTGALNVADAFAHNARTHLHPGGVVWFAGAGCGDGYWHLEQVLSGPQPPAKVLITDTSDQRLEQLKSRFNAQSHECGIDMFYVNHSEMAEEEISEVLNTFAQSGFNDIVFLNSNRSEMELALHHSAKDAIITFTGASRDTELCISFDSVVTQGIRFAGSDGPDGSVVAQQLEVQSTTPSDPDFVVGGCEGSIVEQVGFGVVYPAATGGTMTLDNIKDPQLQQKVTQEGGWGRDCEAIFTTSESLPLQ